MEEVVKHIEEYPQVTLSGLNKEFTNYLVFQYQLAQ